MYFYGARNAPPGDDLLGMSGSPSSPEYYLFEVLMMGPTRTAKMTVKTSGAVAEAAAESVWAALGDYVG